MELETGRIAEDILPAEIWEMIFNHVTNEEDLLSCYYTCNLFRALLKIPVLSKAFSVVQTYVSESSLKLTENDILSCRLVSTHWRRMVDHFLQSHPSKLDLSCYCVSRNSYEGSFADQTETVPNRFASIYLRCQHLEKSTRLVDQITGNAKVNKNRNVVCSRHLVITEMFSVCKQTKEMSLLNKQRFYELVTNFLKKCGSHIWYLTVFSQISNNLPQWFLQTIWKWLPLLPNLKILTVDISLLFLQTSSHLELYDKLQTNVNEQPFPFLPQLVTLQLIGVPNCVLQSALEVNRHVNRLAVEVSPLPGFPLDFLRLKENPLAELCFTVRCIQEFNALTSSKWPLEKLSLRFSIGSDQFYKLQRRLVQLSQFGETLRYLSLKVPNILLRSRDGPPRWQLQIPKLEELQLYLVDMACLDFLLQLRSLRKLNLFVLSSKNCEQPQLKLQNKLCAINKLNECNIWEELPSLRQIQVQIRYRERTAESRKLGCSRTDNIIKFYRGDIKLYSPQVCTSKINCV